MQENIQEALSKGVKMHASGEFECASQLYDSVIKLQPDHAEANHNMGLLKIDTGKDLEALPYFQTALEADKSIAKFWLSYIKGLINLDRKKEASRILSLAKENGADDDEFLELERTLNEPHRIQIRENFGGGEENSSERNILDTYKLDNALRLAKQKSKEGSCGEARAIFQDILYLRDHFQAPHHSR